MLAEFGMAVAAAVVLFVFSSFVEYVVHILMHRRFVLGKLHTLHHKENTADGFLKEFLYYCPLAVPVGTAALAAGIYFGFPGLGVGALIGAVGYAAFAAYAHQVQHERPELVIWMPMPVHTVHHVYQQWRTNFGIGVDWWDRIFGTYERTSWQPDPARRPKSPLDFVRIRWGRAKTPAGASSPSNRVPAAT